MNSTNESGTGNGGKVSVQLKPQSLYLVKLNNPRFKMLNDKQVKAIYQDDGLFKIPFLDNYHLKCYGLESPFVAINECEIIKEVKGK